MLCSLIDDLVPWGLSFRAITAATSDFPDATPHPTPEVLGTILRKGGKRVPAGRLGAVELRPNCWHWSLC